MPLVDRVDLGEGGDTSNSCAASVHVAQSHRRNVLGLSMDPITELTSGHGEVHRFSLSVLSEGDPIVLFSVLRC